MSGSSPDLGHYTAERYLSMGECGILSPDDRVELLDGLIVAMAPASPGHEEAVLRVQYALLRRLGLEVLVRVQSSFLVGSDSVLQPDVAVVPGTLGDYQEKLPSRASLVVEVARSSLAQDRLTKSAIFARAGVPCYWIVNLRDGVVEVYREPDRFRSLYRSVARAIGRDPLVIDDFPGVAFEAGEFLPAPGQRLGPEID